MLAYDWKGEFEVWSSKLTLGIKTYKYGPITYHFSRETECTGILAFLSLEHSVVLFLNSNNIQNQVASALQTVSHKIKGGNILLLVATRQESANNYTSINNYKIFSHSEIRIVYIFLTLPIVYKL